MFAIPETLDFRTVFQIVATFEGFSVWKGSMFFKAGGNADIDVGISRQFDDDAFAARCEALKTSKNKGVEIGRIVGMLVTGKISAVWGGFKRRVSPWGWRLARFLHGGLAFLLRATPLVTIPLLALSYMLQVGCEGDRFGLVPLVCWFVAVKTVCYGVCFVLATLLSRHVKVGVSTSDDGNIIAEGKPAALPGMENVR